MLRRRTMAHLAANPRLSEFQTVRCEACPGQIFQLAGVADSANSLVAGRVIEFFPRAWIGALAFHSVNDLPVVDPSSLQQVVLNRENVNLSVRQFRGISLLKFRADCVV